MPYSFRQVCRFFNVPRNLRVKGIVRRDIQLILIREDLEVKPFADVIAKKKKIRPELNSRPPARQPDAQPTEPPVAACSISMILINQ